MQITQCKSTKFYGPDSASDSEYYKTIEGDNRLKLFNFISLHIESHPNDIAKRILRLKNLGYSSEERELARDRLLLRLHDLILTECYDQWKNNPLDSFAIEELAKARDTYNFALKIEFTKYREDLRLDHLQNSPIPALGVEVCRKVRGYKGPWLNT